MIGVTEELQQNKAKAKSSSSFATKLSGNIRKNFTTATEKLPSQRSQSLEQKSSLDKSPYSSLACKKFL